MNYEGFLDEFAQKERAKADASWTLHLVELSHRLREEIRQRALPPPPPPPRRAVFYRGWFLRSLTAGASMGVLTGVVNAIIGVVSSFVFR